MVQRRGHGSYERRNREQSKEVQYNRFLVAVNKHAKHVLEDLNDEPFRLYLEAGLGFKIDGWGNDLLTVDQAKKQSRARTRHAFNHPNWQRSFEGGSVANKPKEAFRLSLFEWSRRTHLDAAWCREAAYETLNDWSFSHPTSDELEFRLFAKTIVFFSTGRPEKWFRPPQGLFLHPQLYTLEKIEAELHRQVSNYIKDLKSRAKAAGYVLTPEEYQTKKHNNNARFRWLVERVVNEKPYQRIVDELGPKYKHGLSYTTLRKTIIGLARELQLPC